jgi:RimJ/RimL family protein N-acetyltransferase
MSIQVQRDYPQRIPCAGGEVEIRLLRPEDEAAVLAFAQRLSAHDLLFLRRDISQPKVVAAWMEATRGDALITVVAMRDGALLGCATLVRDPLSWSRHVGELRVIVEPALRGQGIGQKLTNECFAIALQIGLDKLMAMMTVDQRGAIAVFEGLGFEPEALLRGHVKDRDGKAHDIVVLGHDVAGFEAQRAAYGLGDAL